MLLKRLSSQYFPDDTALYADSRRNIDYLAYEWEDEQIWSCWKSTKYPREQSPYHSRLENAVWRTWAKLLNNSGVISPTAINWFRENDVSCLYGPSWSNTEKIPSQQTRHTALDSYFKPMSKSILKERNRSDMLIQATRSSFALSRREKSTLQTPSKINWKLRRVLSNLPSTADLEGHLSGNYSKNETSHNYVNIAPIEKPDFKSGRKTIRFCNEVEQRISTRGQESNNQRYIISTEESIRISSESFLLRLFKALRPGMFKRGDEGSKSNLLTGQEMTASSPPTTLKY